MCEKHTWVSDDGSVGLLHGDTVQVMGDLQAESVDAIVTDPPYMVGMDEWDTASAGGTRTAAGWIKNKETARAQAKEFQLQATKWWRAAFRVLKPGGYLLTFSANRTHHRVWMALEEAGFELHDTALWLYSTAMPKVKSALKPAFEPIAVARKPRIGTIKANTEKYGTGDLNIDACRLEGGQKRSKYASGEEDVGRWPTNVLFDEGSAVLLEAQQEGATRFFYCAKVSAKERGDNIHPTVKPIALMRWLVRLVTPPGGIVLDCFVGSGSTAVAAVLEGYRCFGIDLDEEYLEIARRRSKAAITERDGGADV